MASLSLCPEFETNLMSNRKVIELVLQLKSAKAHGRNYIKIKPHLVAIFCVIVYSLRVEPFVSFATDRTLAVGSIQWLSQSFLKGKSQGKSCCS